MLNSQTVSGQVKGRRLYDNCEQESHAIGKCWATKWE
jgi:hypothetical protein